MQIKNKLIFLVLITGFILFYFFNGNDTSYTFRNAEYLKNHYNKHGLEMGFESEEEYKKFKERHEKTKVTRNDISTYEGDCYLGIDAGSTTTKLVLIDKEGNLLYSLYGSNEGNPLKSVMNMLKKLYEIMPKKENRCQSY